MDHEQPPRDPSTAIDWMNARYATVVDGGKMFVIRRHTDPVMGRMVIDYIPYEHFKAAFFGHHSVTWADASGQMVVKPLAVYWLRHQQHRHLPGGVVFDPTGQVPEDQYFNLWSGFSPLALQQQVDVPDAPWAWLKNHILMNICREDEEHYEYVLSWMALGVQRPDIPAGTALVLRGDEGIGKGVFARAYGQLFGAHWLHLNDARQLTGTFNQHLESAIVVFADEAIGTADKAAISKLKTLITEPTIHIEAKYRQAHTARNHIRVILASNDDWVVPAGKDARRYCVLDVGNDQRGVREYFTLIDRELHTGGMGAMLTELLTRDLTNFDVSDIPRTKALLDQKLHSLSTGEHWWLERLREGSLTPGGVWQETIARGTVRDVYLSAMRDLARENRSLEIVRRMSTLLDHVLPYYHDGPRLDGDRTWVFPPLDACRRHFEQLLGQTVNWDE